MATHEQEILRCARAIARLQTQARKFRRQLKQAAADLRIERKHMRALLALRAAEPNVVPSRLFGDGVGHLVPLEPPPAEPEPFCEACQQHRPCSCDDLLADRPGRA